MDGWDEWLDEQEDMTSIKHLWCLREVQCLVDFARYVPSRTSIHRELCLAMLFHADIMMGAMTTQAQ